MNNYLFMFGDTFWLQLQGTVMGTPPSSPLYFILMYGFHENSQLLPNFEANLIYYKH
jgi:hypothetical protein